MDLGGGVADEATRAALSMISTGLGLLAGRPLARLGNADLLATTRQLNQLVSAVQGTRLAHLAEVDTRGAGIEVGASSTLAWVKTTSRARHGHAARDLRLARALTDRYPATAQALSTGQVSLEHAEELQTCLDALPEHIDPDTITEAEQTLLAQAKVYDPNALHQLGHTLHQALDPDGPHDIAAAQADAWNARALYVQTYHDGRVHLRGTLDPVHGSLFLATINPLAAPRDGQHEPTCAPPRNAAPTP